jgi:hypothetical protein
MFFASSAALIINNYVKISMHAIACGGMLGLAYFMIADGTVFSGISMMAAISITALVITARKIASNHTWFELITGLLVGLICQMTALWF